jgi:hypothetical protein
MTLLQATANLARAKDLLQHLLGASCETMLERLSTATASSSQQHAHCQADLTRYVLSPASLMC